MNAEQFPMILGALVMLMATVRQWQTADQSSANAMPSAIGILGISLGLIAVALAMRWTRLGHGPFFTMYEILASNILSLGAIATAAAILWPRCRAALLFALPVLCVMAVWLLTVSPKDSHFAPTYATPILWVHVFAGKLFLGSALISLGFAGLVIARRVGLSMPTAFRQLPTAELDMLAWLFLRLALVFDSAMLLAGAVWAQDAWGRYWAWDPLETWAFVTWLALLAALHWRLRARPEPVIAAVLVCAVFVLAFLTFFGVPFLSVAPHKGAV